MPFQRYDCGSCGRWNASTRSMATSIASRISLEIDTARGAILISPGARLTPSNLAICSATYASPRARTPAIISSATARGVFDSIVRFLDPRDQFADLPRSGPINRLAHDQPRRDLRDQVLHHQLVHAHRLAALHQIDDVRGELEHRRQLHRAAERHDVRAQAARVEVLPRV